MGKIERGDGGGGGGGGGGGERSGEGAEALEDTVVGHSNERKDFSQSSEGNLIELGCFGKLFIKEFEAIFTA